MWTFPICLLATPAVPDDVILIEVAGLNKKAQVGFRLTSLTEYVTIIVFRIKMLD